MKKRSLLSALIFSVVMLALAACNFSVGTNKDLKTGLSTYYNGFRVEEVFLANSAKQHLASNKVPLDSTFLIVANGVENYTLKDGKAYPGCEITITDKTKKIVGHIDDAMADVSVNGLEPALAKVLSARITLHQPFLSGETYHVATRFFDKQNEKNKITGDIDIALQ